MYIICRNSVVHNRQRVQILELRKWSSVKNVNRASESTIKSIVVRFQSNYSGEEQITQHIVLLVVLKKIFILFGQVLLKKLKCPLIDVYKKLDLVEPQDAILLIRRTYGFNCNVRHLHFNWKKFIFDKNLLVDLFQEGWCYLATKSKWYK